MATVTGNIDPVFAQARERLTLDPLPPRFVPFEPTPAQRVFICLPQKKKLFGGAAGPGKSSALLMSALRYVERPDYAALLLRRTYPDLTNPGCLIPKARSWLANSGAIENRTEHRWHFPSGAVLQFGHSQNEGDEERYASAEFQFIGIDEAAQFTRAQYTFLFSRLRRTVTSTVPLTMALASNPIGVGVSWLREIYIDAATRDPETAYLPARMTDNPHLDQASYLESLSNLDPVLRARLLDGDWYVRDAGAIFHREAFLPETDDAILSRVRAWDLAATDGGGCRTVGLLMGRTVKGRFRVLHVVAGQWAPGPRDSVILQTARADPQGTLQLIEQEPGSGGIAQFEAIRRMLTGFWCEPAKPAGEKLERLGPFSSAAHAGRVEIACGEWNRSYLDAMESLPDAGKDEGDASAHAFNWISENCGHGGTLDTGPDERYASEERDRDRPEAIDEQVRPRGPARFS